MTNTAFLLFRAGMGINLLFHAVNRFYNGTHHFSSWMVKEFERTFLPSFSIQVVAGFLPYLEGLIGLMLILGFKTRWGLVAGATLMIALVLGSCLISQWDWATYQMVYLFCFYIMLQNVADDTYSVDRLLTR